MNFTKLRAFFTALLGDLWERLKPERVQDLKAALDDGEPDDEADKEPTPRSG